MRQKRRGSPRRRIVTTQTASYPATTPATANVTNHQNRRMQEKHLDRAFSICDDVFGGADQNFDVGLQAVCFSPALCKQLWPTSESGLEREMNLSPLDPSRWLYHLSLALFNVSVVVWRNSVSRKISLSDLEDPRGSLDDLLENSVVERALLL